MKATLSALVIATLVGCAAHQRQGAAEAQPEPTARSHALPASDLSPEQIRLVQRALADRGYPVDLTGVFDSHTQTALAQFQRARGLPADGKLDPSTLETLGIDPRDVMPVRGSEQDSGAAHEGDSNR
jgi:peptidoglycan hydrolase-like protein with peptidoglycan-binding domain